MTTDTDGHPKSNILWSIQSEIDIAVGMWNQVDAAVLGAVTLTHREMYYRYDP